MAAKSGTGAAWDRAERGLSDANARAALRVEKAVAMERIGLLAVAMARKRIQDRAYAPNSELTVALKGSSTPLVNDGDLFGALTSEVVDDGVWFGVQRQRLTDGGEMTNIALILHEGASIDLARHPKVRQAVMARLRETAEGTGRGASRARRIIAQMKQSGRAANKRASMWSGWGSAKAIWVTPPRPFLADVLRDPDFQARVSAEYAAVPARAMARVMRAAA